MVSFKITLGCEPGIANSFVYGYDSVIKLPDKVQAALLQAYENKPSEQSDTVLAIYSSANSEDLGIVVGKQTHYIADPVAPSKSS